MTGDQLTVPAWARDPDYLEQIFLAAVRAADAQGIDASLRLMAACDPHRADRLLRTLTVGLDLVGLGSRRPGDTS